MNRKWWLLVGVVFVAIAVVGAVIYIADDNEQNAEQETTTETAANELPDSFADFQQIQSDYAQKSYGSAIKNAILFGADETRDDVSRLNAYVLCIKSAQAITDENVVSTCLESGLILARSLTDTEASTQWVTLLTTFGSKQEVEAQNDGPQ